MLRLYLVTHQLALIIVGLTWLSKHLEVSRLLAWCRQTSSTRILSCSHVSIAPIISKLLCRARSASSSVLLRREPALSIAKANSVVIGLRLVWMAGRGLPIGRTIGRAVGFSLPWGRVWLTHSLSFRAFSSVRASTNFCHSFRGRLTWKWMLGWEPQRWKWDFVNWSVNIRITCFV